MSEYTLQNLNGVLALREEMRNSPVHICIERAKYITEYMKSHGDKEREEMPILYRAEAVYHYLSNKKAVIPDNNLLAGTTGAYLKTAPVYPEFIGLTIWSELDSISGRKKNPQLISKEEAQILNFDIFPYWIDRDVLASTKRRNEDFKPIHLLEKMIFYVASKAGCISHTVPDFKRVLEEGLKSIIEEAEEKAAAQPQNSEFYRAVALVLRGTIN